MIEWICKIQRWIPGSGKRDNMNNLNIEIGECIDIKFMDMRIAQTDSTVEHKLSIHRRCRRFCRVY